MTKVICDASEPRTVGDLISSGEDDKLELRGGICNLLSMPLRIVDSQGQLQTTYLQDPNGPAMVVWQDNSKHIVIGSTGLIWEKSMLQKSAPDLWPQILADVEHAGEFNGGFIELVKPTQDLTELLRFWKSAVRYQDAEQVRLPQMKPWRKRPCMTTYCVVSVGVALTAYYRWEDIDLLLVPACPQMGTDGMMSYRALMPAEYLVAGQSDRGIWR